MILTVARNVAGLFVNKDKRALDMIEQRLLTLQVDTRGRVRDAQSIWQAAVDEKKSSGDVQLKYEQLLKAQAQDATVAGLVRDLEAILLRVYAGA
ncbi:hypothetical protein SEA_POKYPUPPY_57 [Gordonia phage PokyPuppy]|nr:hypothetical protein SEA_POKYPUPPY_57 [Gordonia phage PokyPuppy]